MGILELRIRNRWNNDFPFSDFYFMFQHFYEHQEKGWHILHSFTFMTMSGQLSKIKICSQQLIISVSVKKQWHLWSRWSVGSDGPGSVGKHRLIKVTVGGGNGWVSEALKPKHSLWRKMLPEWIHSSAPTYVTFANSEFLISLLTEHLFCALHSAQNLTLDV